MDSFVRDVKYAIRQLVRAPAFTGTVILIVAIGIGVNTAAFSVVNAMLFRPQPFESPWELVDIYQDSDGGEPSSSSFPAYRDMAAYTELFEGVTATAVMSGNLQVGDTLTRAPVEYSTSNYMDVLRLRPAIGRWFEPAEDVAGGEAVAVLTYRTWQQRFGGDPGVLGTVLRVNGGPVTVVGVGPAGFDGYMPLNSVEFWLSLSSLGPLMGEYAMATLQQRGDHWFYVKARLRDGVNTTQVQEAMNDLAARLASEFPEHNQGRGITAFAPGEVRMHPERDAMLSPSAALLMAIVGLVLLIACSNLANLLLVRAIGRGKEVSIRVAMGASRGQVARQLLTESVLLSMIGGGFGVLLAAWATRAFMALELPLPIVAEFGIDGRVLSFALVLSLFTGIAFGLAPATRVSRPDLAGAMRDEVSAVGWRSRRFGLRNALVILQVAVSFVLLVAAGLFIRSLGNAQQINTGFSVDDVAYVQTSPTFAGYEDAEARNLLMDFVERTRLLPGVEDASIATALPVAQRGTTSLVIDGYEPPSGRNSVEVPFSVVDARYFETLRIPLLHGRTFSGVDVADGERVAVITETMARSFWGDSNAVGQRLRSEGNPDGWTRVIGVVGDTIIRDVTEATGPQVYYPWLQSGASVGAVLVRTSGDPGAVLGMMRETLRAIDADIPVLRANTMTAHLNDSLFLPRLGVRLLGGFGFLALTLASLGLYGVVSFAVRRRMVEVGVRMALGADGANVVWLVLRDVIALVAIGVVLGAVSAFAAATGFTGLLFGVSASDPTTFIAAGAVLLLVAVAASLAPALRAASADPVTALRQS